MQAQELRFQTRRSPQTRQKRTYFLRQTFPFSAARKVLLQRLPASFFCWACLHAGNTRSTSRRSPQRSWERYRIVLRSTIWKRYCSQNENPRLFQTQKIQMQELHRPPSRKGYCVRNLPNFFPSAPDLHRRHCIRSNVRIREIRTDNHLTQSQFGEKISVSQDTVSLWEKEKSVPTTEYVIRIAETFFVSADYLLGLSEY